MRSRFGVGLVTAVLAAAGGCARPRADVAEPTAGAEGTAVDAAVSPPPRDRPAGAAPGDRGARVPGQWAETPTSLGEAASAERAKVLEGRVEDRTRAQPEPVDEAAERARRATGAAPDAGPPAAVTP